MLISDVERWGEINPSLLLQSVYTFSNKIQDYFLYSLLRDNFQYSL